ncbi:hypothetical protein [Micromonospora sp. DT31]|uniref:hypothetical protein n=1 Tax=Micromonospora sp. DT31 TaxID=3393434 RepID=UPI003CE6D0F8
MNESYRTAENPAPRAVTRMRPLLWLALVVAVVGNVALSAIMDNPVAGSAFGTVALLCGVTLGVDRYRNR